MLNTRLNSGRLNTHVRNRDARREAPTKMGGGASTILERGHVCENTGVQYVLPLFNITTKIQTCLVPTPVHPDAPTVVAFAAQFPTHRASTQSLTLICSQWWTLTYPANSLPLRRRTAFWWWSHPGVEAAVPRTSVIKMPPRSSWLWRWSTAEMAGLQYCK